MDREKKILFRRERRKKRVRAKIKEVNRKGRLRIYFYHSLRHTYAQVIDDHNGGKTLLTVSTLDPSLYEKGKTMKNQEYAKKVAHLLVEKMRSKGIPIERGFVLDRGAKKYHGKVKAFAEALREEGIKI